MNTPTDAEIDAMLDRMDRGEPPRDEAEAAQRRPYERMIEALRTTPPMEPPAGWEARALERWRRRG